MDDQKTFKRSHHQLKAWQESMKLVEAIYALTARFPNEEKFGLTSQMRRAAVSVPSNIAEGAARSTTKEFLNFLAIARGSLSELDTQLLLSKNLGYTRDVNLLEERINTVFKLLNGLIRSLRNRNT